MRADSCWVDPQLKALLAALPPLTALSDETLADVRALLSSGDIGQSDDNLAVEFVRIPASEGDLAVEAVLYQPRSGAKERPALLNIHGGGYVAGSAAREDAAMREMAQALGCTVLSVNYRLAPETPYPGPLEDCYAALAWLDAQADALDVDKRRIAVRGVSAGGGLAAGLALLARDRGGPVPVCVTLLYPMLDHRTTGTPALGQHVWSAEANRYGWASYLGNAVPDGYSVPALAETLEGFPPCFLAVGSIDLFVVEDLAFAGRLAGAGIPVEMRLYAGAYHGFNLVAASEAAQAYKADERRALRRAFDGEFSSSSVSNFRS